MNSFLSTLDFIVIKQVKEIFEIAINWETANKYSIQTKDGVKVGFAAERTNGIFHKILRNILRSHRSMTIDIWDRDKNHKLIGSRPFYFFFSKLLVQTDKEENIGEIKTRFGILKRKYDLLDRAGNVFARVESFRFRLWTFKILNSHREEKGVISKKWGGVLKEVFTDSDQFGLDLSKQAWTEEQKAVLLFATLCIDLDFFEDNSGSITSLFD